MDQSFIESQGGKSIKTADNNTSAQANSRSSKSAGAHYHTQSRGNANHDIDVMELVSRLENYLDKNDIFDLTDKFDTVFSDNGKPITQVDQFVNFISNKELGFTPQEV